MARGTSRSSSAATEGVDADRRVVPDEMQGGGPDAVRVAGRQAHADEPADRGPDPVARLDA
jgi:hypothetical protein